MTAPARPVLAEHNAAQVALARIEAKRHKKRRVQDDVVQAAHGGGGRAMRDLIEDLILPAFDHAVAEDDQARFALSDMAALGGQLAFTTDTYVVTPLTFPGGDIGSMAVHGTINDLAVGGAKPLYLSCGLILEEGLPIDLLRTILTSMGRAAREAGVRIVTGDTKVVARGKADKLFINTAGVGVIPTGLHMSARSLEPGDVLLTNGTLGDHGAAILIARGELELASPVMSDSAPLHELVQALVQAVPVRAMRDLTRGGLAATVNEWAHSANLGLCIDEPSVPVRSEVQGVCELLGLDPLHLANEGKLLAAVPKAHAQAALHAMRRHPLGENAAVVGEVTSAHPGVVTIQTGFGTDRVLDMLVGEPLPRIC
ncbi:MAG: hydrogenase expression/formation protein HypE [Myxococcales bacterium]|nr:hydrogenase expression/formation protein HypE [Myxococcales bacterium]